jgi:hypothetical protein
MKMLKPVETDQYSLEVIECNCGYHMGLDSTFLEQVGEIITICPSCGIQIETARVDAELMKDTEWVNKLKKDGYVYIEY